jgi:putative thioredoxin
MTSEFVVNVNENDFDYEVLLYSQNVPVLVDYWAEWSNPCKILEPILEKLAEEGHGSFRLARVDVDYNRNIAIRYGIRSIPVVKGFLKGQVVAEFSGIQPDIKIREFIRSLAPSPADLLLEKAGSLLQESSWGEAEKTYREVLELDPDSPVGLIGLSRCLLARGNSAESLPILKHFPASHEYSLAETLIPLAEVFSIQERMPYQGDDPLEAAMWNCIRLAKRGNFPSALDGLLDIMKHNKNFKNGMIRQLIIAILQVLGDENPETRKYRAELAAILF